MTLRRIDLAVTPTEEVASLLRRSSVPDGAIRRSAAAIVDDVRARGDVAVREAAARFGGGRSDGSLRVEKAQLAAAGDALEPVTLAALQAAAGAIRAVHEPQLPRGHVVEPLVGVRVERSWSPLRRVGVYVPGGLAPYPSSVLMAVIPAQVAGVPEVAITSPAGPDGEVPPALLAAADLLDIDEVYAMGGAQAVAALAYGTETVAAADKIVGPGNAWVTAAKLAVFGDVGIDLPAGPSEALELVDHTADPQVVAADLISQAEHGPDSIAVLVSPDAAVVDAVLLAVDDLIPRLDRAEIIAESLARQGLAVVAGSMEQALAFADAFAPEHLSIQTEDPAMHAAAVPSAGSVFLGHWSPHSAGDYATGANHVLPTGGLARAYGPLSVEDFGSWRQVQTLTREGLASIRPTVGAIAAVEGLTAHRWSVDVRFEDRP
jgi:histidinol dehydrogenase